MTAILSIRSLSVSLPTFISKSSPGRSIEGSFRYFFLIKQHYCGQVVGTQKPLRAYVFLVCIYCKCKQIYEIIINAGWRMKMTFNLMSTSFIKLFKREVSRLKLKLIPEHEQEHQELR